jgi:exodeoxyribonuclease V alpha subunit
MEGHRGNRGGLVRAVDTEAGELLVDFDGREVAYDFGELDELVLAYATTVHKAQGSEYLAVVLPVTTQHWPMLQRNLLYTGVTRGRKLVVLVAQPKAVAIAVKGQQERRRWSKPKEWLSTEPADSSHAAAAGGLAFPISDEGRLSQSHREHLLAGFLG